MEMLNFRKVLRECFKENNLLDLLDNDKEEKLFGFAELLIETNKQMNLTAITDMEGVIFKHFTDCARAVRHFEANSSVIDVGCGAGFPSMPLAILRPDLKVTALDSTTKKTVFIQNCANKLEISNITSVAARAEEFVSDHREAYDYATSRAVARLNVLCELCLPLVRKGGKFVPMKATQANDELDEAKNAIKTLGGELEDKDSYTLTFNTEVLDRHIFLIKKVHHTTAIYPRKYAQILKKPL